MAFIRRGAMFCCSVALGLVVVLSDVAAQDRVISNLELMKKLGTEASDELIGSVPGTIRLGHVRLVPYTADEHHEFIDNVLAQFLTSTGHTVYAPAGRQAVDSLVTGGSANEMLRLEYRVLNFDLSYPKVYRSYLIGGKKVKRSADIKLLAKLVNPVDESVLWIGEASRSYEDQFSHKLLPEVEEGLFAFTKPAQSTTKWGKVAEPVVVTGIIVGLIYLFFSNQDNN